MRIERDPSECETAIAAEVFFFLSARARLPSLSDTPNRFLDCAVRVDRVDEVGNYELTVKWSPEAVARRSRTGGRR